MIPNDDSKYRTYCYECDSHHKGECDKDESSYDEYDMWREKENDLRDGFN